MQTRFTQDTGFGSVLPTGEGLFAFNTMEEILGPSRPSMLTVKGMVRRTREVADEAAKTISSSSDTAANV